MCDKLAGAMIKNICNVCKNTYQLLKIRNRSTNFMLKKLSMNSFIFMLVTLICLQTLVNKRTS